LQYYLLNITEVGSRPTHQQQQLQQSSRRQVFFPHISAKKKTAAGSVVTTEVSNYLDGGFVAAYPPRIKQLILNLVLQQQLLRLKDFHWRRAFTQMRSNL